METTENTKRKVKSVKNGSNNPEAKRVKSTIGRVDYNKYFSDSEKLLDSTAEKEKQSDSVSRVKGNVASSSSSSSSSSQSSVQNQIEQNIFSDQQLIQMVQSMSAVCHVSLNQLESACETINFYRTKSKLGTRQIEISEADGPLLTMFEKYDLPLKTKEEIERLENELEKSNDFLKFFVSPKLRFSVSIFAFANKSYF